MKGPTGTWTRIAGFKVQSDNHYTIGPLQIDQVHFNLASAPVQSQSLFLNFD